MDFLRNGGHSGLYRLYYPLCVSEIKVHQCPAGTHGVMDSDGTCAKFTSFSIQKVARPSGTNLQLAAETCEFAQVPSLSIGARGTFMYLNLTFMN